MGRLISDPGSIYHQHVMASVMH